MEPFDRTHANKEILNANKVSFEIKKLVISHFFDLS